MASASTKPKIFSSSSLFISQSSKLQKSYALSFLHNTSKPLINSLKHQQHSYNHVNNNSLNAIKSVLNTTPTTAKTTIEKNSWPGTTSDSPSHIPRPTILVSEKLGEAGLQVLREFGHVECAYDMSPDDLCAKISACDALIVRSGTKVTRQVFEASKGRLKVVGRAGVGIDNVDLTAATEFGCLVVNAPTANTVAAAEHGIALLAAMARNVAQADASIKAGKNFTFENLISPW